MKKDRIYLDTSLPSAYHDARQPERQRKTQEFWRTFLPEFDVYVSEVTLAELMQTENAERREQLLRLVAPYVRLDSSEEAEELAEHFVEEGVVPEEEPEDALHLAIAVVDGKDILVSWNFEHMVNFNTKRLLPMLCAKHGYFKPLMIVSPLEFPRRAS